VRGTPAATTAGGLPMRVGGDFVLPMDFFADEKKAKAKNDDDGQRLPHDGTLTLSFRADS
jgi:hypothetical protein